MPGFDSKGIERKTRIDRIVKTLLLSVTIMCSSLIVLIAIFIFTKGIGPFVKIYEVNGEKYRINLFTFLTGGEWFKNPNVYGAGFIVVDTIYITLIALVIAVPISILTALFVSRIAPKWLSRILSGAIELLSSIPSVIFGLFGSFIVTGGIKKISLVLGFQSAGGISGLSAAIVLAMMIIPTITIVSITSINAVKKDLVLGSLALGTSITKTNFQIVLRSSFSGIFSGIILGIGRALGEATAVSMVIGNAGSGPNFNLFQISRTLTSTMMSGIHETTGMNYDIRFSVGVLLILLILVSNILLNALKKRIGEKNGR